MWPFNPRRPAPRYLGSRSSTDSIIFAVGTKLYLWGEHAATVKTTIHVDDLLSAHYFEFHGKWALSPGATAFLLIMEYQSA